MPCKPPTAEAGSQVPEPSPAFHIAQAQEAGPESGAGTPTQALEMRVFPTRDKREAHTCPVVSILEEGLQHVPWGLWGQCHSAVWCLAPKGVGLGGW